MIQNKNVPKLRFEEFDGEWKEEKLQNLIIDFNEKSEINNKYPVLTSSRNGIVLQSNYFKSDRLTNRSNLGFNIIPLGYLTYRSRTDDGKFKFNINENGKGIVSTYYPVFTVNGSPYFFYYKLGQIGKVLYKHSVGTSQKVLAHTELKKIKVRIPKIEEQTKISDFLKFVDSRINKLNLKIDLLQKYKKAMMKKVFSQGIQFKDYDGQQYSSWKKMRFGEVFERIVTKNIDNNKNVLTISAQQGLISQTDYFNKSVSSANLTGYYHLEKGDFAYNKSYSADYPMGAIKKLNNYNEGVVSTLYICFRVKKGYSPEFFEQYFNAGLQNREISMIAQEGARNHGLLNIGVNDFFDGVILNVPNIDEQQKIAECLMLQDEKINLTKKELEHAKMFKKGLLQQMFV